MPSTQRPLNTTEAIMYRTHIMGIDTPLVGQVYLEVKDPKFDVNHFQAKLQESLTKLILTTPALQEVVTMDGEGITGATDEQIFGAKVIRDDSPNALDTMLESNFNMTEQLAIKVVVTKESPNTIIVSLVIGHVISDGDSMFTVLDELLKNLDSEIRQPIQRVAWSPRPQPYELPTIITPWHELTGMSMYAWIYLRRQLFGCWKPLTGDRKELIPQLRDHPEKFPHYTETATIPEETMEKLRAACRLRKITLTTLFNTVGMVSAMQLFQQERVSVQSTINMRLRHLPTAGLGCYSADSDIATGVVKDPTKPIDFWALAKSNQWMVEPKAIDRAIGRSFFLRHMNVRNMASDIMLTGDCVSTSFISANFGVPRHFHPTYYKGKLGVVKTQFFYGALAPLMGISTWKDTHLTLTCRSSMLTKQQTKDWMTTCAKMLTKLALKA